MRVLGIVCSPRKGANTEIMVESALAGAHSCGAETELWTVSGKTLQPCDGCGVCKKKDGECHIKDDMQELYPKILAADGLIFGSPAYFHSGTAQAKTVVDRLYCLYFQNMLVNKVAAVVTVANSRGHEGVRLMFYEFMDSCHMFAAGSTKGYGRDKGEVRKDDYAMKSSEILGKQVASLVKQQLRWPEEYRKPIYRITRETYGIDSYPLRHTRQRK